MFGGLNPFNTNLFNFYNFKRREHHQLLHKSLNLPTEEVNRWTVVIQHKQIRPTGWGGVHFSTGTLCSWNLLIEKLVMRRFSILPCDNIDSHQNTSVLQVLLKSVKAQWGTLNMPASWLIWCSPSKQKLQPFTLTLHVSVITFHCSVNTEDSCGK